MTVPNEDELAALSAPSVPAPGDQMPDPEPEVLARAQLILNESPGGPVATVSAREERVESDTGLTNTQKLMFMAHVLQGTPYTRVFSLFGQDELTFYTLSPTEEEFLRDLVQDDLQKDLIQPGQAARRYDSYAKLFSLKAYRSPGKEKATFEHVRVVHAAWIEGLSSGVYHIIDQFYRTFVRELNELYSKVDDPDFWPTP